MTFEWYLTKQIENFLDYITFFFFYLDHVAI